MEMDEEKKVAEAEQSAAEPAKKKKKLPIVLGIIVVVVAIAGVGFWNWHAQPSFCNAICHNMDSVVETYGAAPNAAATDKWGNEVENSNAMMAVVHAQNDVNCLGCHVPSINQQVSEGVMFVTGNYDKVIPERSTTQLVENRGEDADGDAFCINDSCHVGITREVLTEATESMDFNPHRWQHGNVDCSECHKAHRASVFYCTQCHSEAEASIPVGWVSAQEGNQLKEASLANEG